MCVPPWWAAAVTGSALVTLALPNSREQAIDRSYEITAYTEALGRQELKALLFEKSSKRAIRPVGEVVLDDH
jgi:hypothetical protein